MNNNTNILGVALASNDCPGSSAVTASADCGGSFESVSATFVAFTKSVAVLGGFRSP